MLIYTCTNTINNKVYVGKTIRSLKHRINQHVASVNRGSSTYFHNALRKYGSNKFSWDVIDGAISKEVLIEKEIHWISKLKSSKKSFGYNITPGGDGFTGIHSKQTRHKMSLLKRGAKAPTWKGGISKRPGYDREWQRQWRKKDPERYTKYYLTYYIKKLDYVPTAQEVATPEERRQLIKRLASKYNKRYRESKNEKRNLGRLP